MKKITIGLWFFTILGLFFYSFTQVDLNLTLIKHPFINQIIKSFQYLGYFQRPLSTYIFLLFVLLLFLLYFLFLALAKNGNLSRREFWLVIICTSVILLFSYPAFSYDIFNYMFDAKTIVIYHQSPWYTKPLDFIGDPWLSFMHWTHRPSVYPPGWILLSLPFFIAGFNYFTLILLNFKLLMALGFLGSVWMLEKLLSPDERHVITALVFYAFNPLMLIENLVSGHNDIVMMFFVLLSFWFALQKKKLFSIFYFLFSIFTKYITAVLLPVIFFYDWFRKKTGEVIIYRYSLIIVFLAFLFFITRVEIQPWYLVWLIPFIVLSGWKFLYPVTIGLSLGFLLRYVPFLYQGNWDNPVPAYEFWLTLIPFIFSVCFVPFLLKRRVL
ncbi:hypothetical protein HZA75_04980 [Candidatus Roizmanbacteria bacterium]|nr:hypothetical protein [Candidatus Roizmanbacteria bacterium]